MLKKYDPLVMSELPTWLKLTLAASLLGSLACNLFLPGAARYPLLLAALSIGVGYTLRYFKRA